MNLKILSLLAGGLVTAGGATTAVIISQNKEVKADEEITSSAPSDSMNEDNDGKEHESHGTTRNDETENENLGKSLPLTSENLDTSRTSTALSNPSGDEEQRSSQTNSDSGTITHSNQ